MDKYVIPVPSVKSLPVIGHKARFPVRRIYCIGRNYADHVKEMGGDPKRHPPIFFTKSRETIVQTGTRLPYPTATNNLHYEVELVVAMADAHNIFGYGVGLDMTRRDLQARAKQGGKPWDMAKNFDQSAPCSALTPKTSAPDFHKAKMTLALNGVVKQNSQLGKMIWTVDEILTHLKGLVTLKAGDLVFTGTPAGVGPVQPGQTLRGHIAGLETIEVSYE